MQNEPNMCYSEYGVIAIDDTVIDDSGNFLLRTWSTIDNSEERKKLAYDYLIVNYVCDSGKHYSLEFRRFKKKEQCDATGETFKDHTHNCFEGWLIGHMISKSRLF